jgi:hypothetical protein
MTKPHWTRWETKFLVKNHEVMTDEQLADRLPGRTACCVRVKRTRMGLLRFKPWTTADLRLVKNERNQRTARDLGEDLGRSEEAMWKFWQRVGLESPHGQTKRVAA